MPAQLLAYEQDKQAEPFACRPQATIPREAHCSGVSQRKQLRTSSRYGQATTYLIAFERSDMQAVAKLRSAATASITVRSDSSSQSVQTRLSAPSNVV